MDVRLSPEQEALRASAAQVVERLGPRSVADLDDAGRTARLRQAVADTGWLELRQPGPGGAPLASGVEVAVVAEELGRALADVAFSGPMLAADLRRRTGAASAEEFETVLLDPAMVLPALSLPTASPDGVALDAAGASWAVVLVDDGAGHATGLGRVALCPGGTQLDLTRASAVPDATAAVVVLDGAGVLDDDDLAAFLALGLALTCADLVGVMRGALELARAYAVERRQYGAPVGSFQAVAHLLADALVATEGSASVARHAAWAVDALAPAEALGAAALAKAYCARAARSVCETSVQVHGGIGNTWDCLAHVYLRRALLSSDLLGGAEVNLSRVLAHHGVGAAAGGGRGVR